MYNVPCYGYWRLCSYVQVYSSWATAQEVHTGRTAAEASNLQAQFVAQLLNTVVVGVCFLHFPALSAMQFRENDRVPSFPINYFMFPTNAIRGPRDGPSTVYR